jgi:FAD/FMN-containing dehydrogenase/Fe-S oxidoreductase
MKNLLPETINELDRALKSHVRTDEVTRYLYSTDASIYQIQPIAVIYPKDVEDIHAAIEILGDYQIPVLPRGAGSSLAGQSIGPAVILDLSRFMRRKLQINPDNHSVIVDPGVTLAEINAAASPHQLKFGPDPASADRATVAGSIANNATGAHSILYGMAADHLLSVDVIMADGRKEKFAPVKLSVAKQKVLDQPDNLASNLYRIALDIRNNHSNIIRDNWPRVWRRSSGYNIHYLLPWSPATPPFWSTWQNHDRTHELLSYPPVQDNEVNLACLFAGSEGSLGVITELELRLVSLPGSTALAVLSFDSIAEACDATYEILDYKPSAIELLPGSIIRFARSIPAYARQLTFISGDPEALLIVEFEGKNSKEAVSKAKQLNHALIGDTLAQQKHIWDVRNMGLGILNSRPGDEKPIAIVEDLAVPVESLGFFVREMDKIMDHHGTTAEFYAHASAGCLHIRPVINLKQRAGIEKMRLISTAAVELTLSLKGSVSGEHGDGLARSEWVEKAFGSDITALFRHVKWAADPNNLMNPGKIIDPPKLDTNLRYGLTYSTKPWSTELSFEREHGMDRAIEMCNGAGVCLKQNGVMCPSFQATRDEIHSTRGRANLLRAMIAGHIQPAHGGEQAVFEALGLCLACKGCKSECPSAVDIAKLRSEFLHQYYKTRRRKVRDYFFGYIGSVAPFGSLLSGMVNPLFGIDITRKFLDQRFGITSKRPLPEFASFYQRRKLSRGIPKLDHEFHDAAILIGDAFSKYMHPEIEADTCRVFARAGIRLIRLPIHGTGRTFISKGMLSQAKRHALLLINEIKRVDPTGKLPIVGIEPSEIYTLQDEYLDFFPSKHPAHELGKRSWTIEEYLVRPGKDRGLRIAVLKLAELNTLPGKVLLHGHCYQKTRLPAEDGHPIGVDASRQLLELSGYDVQEINSGCCGMAGAFGYETEHYHLSMEIGEQVLFPFVRRAGENDLIAASGTSCRSQIFDGTGQKAYHPISLLAKKIPANQGLSI